MQNSHHQYCAMSTAMCLQPVSELLRTEGEHSFSFFFKYALCDVTTCHHNLCECFKSALSRRDSINRGLTSLEAVKMLNIAALNDTATT